jgi:hypothetical protein
MIGWLIVNVASSVVVACIVAYKLGAYPDRFSLGEKIGMGLISTGMLLRIGPMLGKSLDVASPYDDWSVSLLHVGLAVYFVSRMLRYKMTGIVARMLPDRFSH